MGERQALTDPRNRGKMSFHSASQNDSRQEYCDISTKNYYKGKGIPQGYMFGSNNPHSSQK